jgi:hypothetical protein
VVNESDSEVVLKRGNGGVFVILSKLTGRGDRFTIKTEPNATYQEYKLVGTSSDGSSMPFLITSDDCIEHERIIIKRDRVAMIRRGMSVTEVVNLTRRCFTVKQGTTVIEVLKAEGEYLIQRDPKEKSEAYLEEGENPPIVISVEDLVNNQRITVSETSNGNPAASTAMVRRGLYLTEVCNRTDTSFTVKYGEGSNPSTELATLEGGMNKSVTIEYDPTTRNREYWVDSGTQTLFISSEDFVKSKRIDIIKRDSSPSAELESVELRPVSTPTPKKTLLSKIYEWTVGL